MNHFGTRKGERVMVPEFGTIIYDMLMEPMDSKVKKLIIDDAILYHKKISEAKTFRGCNRDGIIAATIYISFKYIPFFHTI